MVQNDLHIVNFAAQTFEFILGPGLKMVSVNAKCDTPLGMESGEVGASDVTASSTLVVPDEDYSATQGRLNNKPLRLNGVNFQGMLACRKEATLSRTQRTENLCLMFWLGISMIYNYYAS